ncbi:ubiquitin-activating enzyme E1 [Strigomonas culicis]|uniref:Ubiquitin-like 1-activating enzyme E1A n=1 Tax=Strigomonas culicis TaxID=28005 RepID=S9VKD5_9TRYP|nr:ubiquitin-activating enzyme E1 [Strigomonas culicis]EPY25877.1 ubiquitin-activating enzyme E1 [Strigomonas culicis]|eukprot:EPY23660.1 ubiquitin-activating enzyme E1 [Strigomonas culicis]
MSEENAIDQKYLDKQSRTIGTYGLETMTKLISFKILIVGCGGVGIEIAKNLSLAGVHTINLYDPTKCSIVAMGTNFAITEEAVKAGKTLGEVSASFIAELNPNTRVHEVKDLTEEAVAKNTAIIFTAAAPDLSSKTLIKWNDFCRQQKPQISFFLALQYGAVGSVFADLGDHFFVKDKDGRSALQKSVLEVTTLTDKDGDSYSRIRFETPEGQTAGALRDYTQIKFTDVEGLCKPDGTSVNNQVFDGVVCSADPRNTVRVYPSFESQGYTPYKTAGFIHEVKEVTELHFRPLSEALAAPGDFIPVSPMMDNSEESQTHILTNALLLFADKHGGKLPSLHNAEEADEVVQIAKELVESNAKLPKPTKEETEQKKAKEEFPSVVPPPPPPMPLVVEEVDTASVKTEAMIASVELQPLASFFGAILAQEVVKITGKYMPIFQWFHLSAVAVLPDGVDYTKEEYKPTGTRYDQLTSIFGRTFQQKIENLKVFMVGCGALGCENIKNFALCGISCGPKGSLVVTDNDRIEISNLSRQFLFREDNVGQPKSAAAGARMKQMNPSAHVDARQDLIGPSSEHLYPDTFWSSLDVVVNALDNMEARLYVDQRCVRSSKVLVEAGTMGTGGNVDIIVPHKTSSYADGGAADQSGGIPMCTLRNFPYIYDHCIEWARAQFDDMFVFPMQAAGQLIEDPDAFIGRVTSEVARAQNDGERRSLIEKHLTPLKNVVRTLSVVAAKPNMEQCTQLGWELLFQLFRDRILDLQKAFPQDAKKSNGEPFWSGHRKYPHAVEADPTAITKDENIMNFLISVVNLYACMFGVHPAKPEARFNDEKNRWMKEYRSAEWLQGAVAALKVPDYVAGNVDSLEEDIAKDNKNSTPERSVEEQQQELQQLLEKARDLADKSKQSKAAPLEFEKDDDDNFQIDFIAACSNLRAANYGIPTADRLKVKLVAGKIIPAIATTTSAVTGLALVELFKVLQHKDVSSLRNGMIDVGTNNYVLFERDEPIKNRTKIESSYLPEQDYTYKKKIIRVPEGFTKYDSIDIPVTPQTTVEEFGNLLLTRLNATLPPDAEAKYEVDGIGVGTGMIWNGSKRHSNTNVSLMHVIEQQKIAETAGKGLPRPFWENRTQFCDLSVIISIDDGDDTVDEVDVETAMIRLVIEHM